jgi:hypothetical protein
LIPYIGDFVINSTLRYYYASNAAGGASAARTTAGTYRVYKNISTTERTSSAGITDYSGFDSVTGLNAVTIDLSNNTDAGFYAAGNDYVVVLVGAVVDSLTVNVPLFQFSIENRVPTVALTSGVWGNATRTLTASLDPTAAQIADAVWDEAYADHVAAGTFGKLMDILRKSNYVTEGTVTSSASPSVNEFSTTLVGLDGTYDHQTLLFVTGDLAGESKPVLTFLQSNGLVTVEEDFTLIPQTGDEFVILPDHVHAVIGIADGILNRLLDSSGSSADVFNERTVRSALRAMRNKVSVSNGTMAVYKEDDTEAAWEGTVSNTADVTVNPDGGSS